MAEVDGPSLKPLDRFVRAWRIRQACRYIPNGARLLDVGCHDGALFRACSAKLASAVGVDPELARSATAGRFRFVKGAFPPADLEAGSVDVITFLAVLEHLDEATLPSIATTCEQLLAIGGVLIATVPSRRVDSILHLLARLRLVAGISLHEHHGFDVRALPTVLAACGLSLRVHRRFEAGLNHLFVFEKSRL